MRTRLHSGFVLACAGALAFTAAALAGDLNPPAGPVAPTMKTLSEVEPRTPINSLPGVASAVYIIHNPGSYYLTADVVGEPGKHGIVIGASNVTIDLNGFALRGMPGSLSGVFPGAINSGTVVRNGSVIGWGGTGVQLGNGSSHVVERVVAESNGGAGISVATMSEVIDCTARLNTSGGIQTGSYGRVVRCSAVSNGDIGVATGNASVVVSSTSASNGNAGFFGAVGTTFRDCTARLNASFGFNSSGLVSGCSASNNTGSGFLLLGAAVAEGCSSTQNGAAGFEVISSATIRGCTSTFNTFDGVFVGSSDGVLIEGSTISNNTLSGVFGVNNVRVIDCNVWNNGTHGISLQNNAVVERCSVSSNGQHGVTVGSVARIVGSAIGQNTVDGLRVSGTEGRVEDNDASNNGGIGFNIIGGFNLVVRNRASVNNPDFFIGAGNRAGAIEPTITATTGPWANFSY